MYVLCVCVRGVVCVECVCGCVRVRVRVTTFVQLVSYSVRKSLASREVGSLLGRNKAESYGHSLGKKGRQ